MGTISPYGLGRCRGCGRPVRWSTTEAGNAMPLDPEPDDTGNVVARLGGGPGWWSRIPNADRPQRDTERRFMPHVATCPNPPLRPAPPRPPAPAQAPQAPPPEAHAQLTLPLQLTEPLPPGVASLADHRARKDRTT